MEIKKENKVSNYFLGPKADNAEILKKNIKLIFDDYIYWRRNYYPRDKVHSKKDKEWFEKLSYELQNVLTTLKANYPFYSPRYMGHMLSETIIPGILGFFAGMLFNPNNVTEEAAPVTVNMELEFGKKICEMLGFKGDKENTNEGFAHICSGGSIANLEALWYAREIQFLPLIAQEFCIEYGLADFLIKTPNAEGKENAKLKKLEEKQLLSLKPGEKIHISPKLISYYMEKKEKNKDQAIQDYNNFVKEKSKYSVRWKGFANVMSNIKSKPVIFVPETAHYSWDKAISILGYGNESIKRIPINEYFRIDADKLKEAINNMKEDEFIVAVITVAGTTEEGAVDPIHEVLKIRTELEKEKNMSFWLHIDSAWGGFIRSLFMTSDFQDILKNEEKCQKLNLENNFIEDKEILKVRKVKLEDEKNKKIEKLISLLGVREDFIFDKTFNTNFKAKKEYKENIFNKAKTEIKKKEIKEKKEKKEYKEKEEIKEKKEHKEKEEIKEKKEYKEKEEIKEKKEYKENIFNKAKTEIKKKKEKKEIKEKIESKESKIDNKKKKETIEWSDYEVIQAFSKFRYADSITIDPHKLGYIQYPAGVIAFRDSNAVQFICQKASYISKGMYNGVEKITMDKVKAIGPYIIEGSKPGAAAVACWLTEKTIPFNIDNFGEIIKITLLNAQRFAKYIQKLNNENNTIFKSLIKNKILKLPYKIIKLSNKIDTNIVCFFVLPMKWDNENDGIKRDEELNLKKMNELNEKIYEHYTIINESDNYIYPYSLKFFISRTKLTCDQYSLNSMQKLFVINKIKESEYQNEGLFILRVTLMNPCYYNHQPESTDYYFEFFKDFNEVIIKEINKLYTSDGY